MKHGTITGYTTDRCRCEECRAAWRRYARKWARESRSGLKRLTDAADTRAHLFHLVDAGHSVAAIESMTGLSDAALRNVMTGRTRRVRLSTQERVLGVTVDQVPGDRNLVPSRCARLLLRQMRTSGIRAKDVVAWLGYRPSSSIPSARNPRILVRNHRRVAVLYELLARRGLVPAELLAEVTS